jgi:L-fuconolactonase
MSMDFTGRTDRRGFLCQSAAVAGTAFWGRSAYSSPAKDEPELLDIIDCHTHFYDPSRPEGVPWPGKDSPLYRTVLPEHLRALPKLRPLTGTVIVEASPWVEDNQWLLDLAKEDPFIVGIVGNLQLGDERFAEHLRRFAADPLFRGIRALHRPVEEQLASGKLDVFKHLADRDLTLDVNGGPEMPLAVARLARELPELKIVINHLANVRIDREGPPDEWIQAMRSAAGGENVYCKVSALAEKAARPEERAPTELELYRPYLDVVWETFGPKRVIYGSNWPVSDRAADYAGVQRIVLDYVTPLGEQAMQDFFSLNAARAYQWIDRPNRAAHVTSS